MTARSAPPVAMLPLVVIGLNATEPNSWVAFGLLLYVVLQIGLLIQKYWAIFQGGSAPK